MQACRRILVMILRQVNEAFLLVNQLMISQLKVAEEYAPKIMPILLQFIDYPSKRYVGSQIAFCLLILALFRIKFLVCSFIIRYCEQVDEEENLEPHLQPLLEKLYALSDDSNLAMRQEAILAICSFLMVSDTAFVKVTMYGGMSKGRHLD